MGEVYRARDARLQRDVAVKVLPQALSLDADRLRRFEQEALATAALHHPNILAVFDMGTHEGAPYVVSELLEAETLREKTAQRCHCNVQDFRVCGANFTGTRRSPGTLADLRGDILRSRRFRRSPFFCRRKCLRLRLPARTTGAYGVTGLK
jgi:hypothetical protein